jgi:two-component system KDP operon response regulator KdpE
VLSAGLFQCTAPLYFLILGAELYLNNLSSLWGPSHTEGGKGIQLLKSSSFDIVILDINLPDIDGFKILHKVRSFSDIPIIILTVRGNDEDKQRGLDLGANDYINKPFRPKDLIERTKAAYQQK